MKCTEVGSTNAEIAGLGIILAFAIQAFISLILSSWSFYLRDVLERGSRKDKNSKANCRLKRKAVDRVLATGADVQVLTGIALIVSGLVQSHSLDLYHFHIVYDTVNFTGVSFCAALLCSFAHKDERKVYRILAIITFSILYLAFSIIFGKHLAAWDYAIPGSCYNTDHIATVDASHPYVDRIYLGITCFYLYAVLTCSIAFSFEVKGPISALFIFYRLAVLNCAFLQYPLHLYNIFALRASNQHLLTGESENTWGFGQIVALIMVGQTLIECFRSMKGPVFCGRSPSDQWHANEYTEYQEDLKEKEENTSTATTASNLPSRANTPQLAPTPPPSLIPDIENALARRPRTL